MLYNFFLTLLFPFFLPRALKKHRKTWKERLGLKLPKCGPVDIWIHAISMGETKAAAAYIKELRKTHPNIKIALSALTETGFAEGERSIPDLAAHFIMPIDFSLVSWILARRLSQNSLFSWKATFGSISSLFLKTAAHKLPSSMENSPKDHSSATAFSAPSSPASIFSACRQRRIKSAFCSSAYQRSAST